MEQRFEIVLLDEAAEFLKSLGTKAEAKVLFNLKLAKLKQDRDLFKKVRDEIWEFRTLYAGVQYRLLAFWDKTDVQETLVIVTHGFVKKTEKAPAREIERAERIRTIYFSTR